MDSDTLTQIQAIMEREVGHVLVAVHSLSGDVKDLETRIRAMEVQSSKVITELQAQTSQLAAKQKEIQVDLNNIGLRVDAQIKLMHQSEKNILEIVDGVYVSKETLSNWKLQLEQGLSKAWKDHEDDYNKDKLEQQKINTTNENIRGVVWASFIIGLGMILQLFWKIYLAGGIQNYAQSMQP